MAVNDGAKAKIVLYKESIYSFMRLDNGYVHLFIKYIQEEKFYLRYYVRNSECKTFQSSCYPPWAISGKEETSQRINYSELKNYEEKM